MKWFKFYGQDWLTDMKIMSISTEDRLCFITLLCLASAGDADGTIQMCEEEAVIRMTHLYEDPLNTDNEVTRARGFMERLIKKGMITRDNEGNVSIVNFTKRQGQNLSGYERLKRHREKVKTLQNKDILDDNDDNVSDNGNDNARIDKNRIERIPDEVNSSEPSEEEDDTDSFEEFMQSKGYEMDSLVDEDTTSEWWQDGDGKKLKKSEVNKLKTTFENHLRGKKAAKTKKADLAKRSTFAYTETLEALRVSSRKEEKVLALVWFRANYSLKSYDQYRARYARDIKFARELVGYSGEEIDQAIEMAEEESKKLGYEWGISTVAKKILHVSK